ncbi:MAG: hypothetical protein GX663_09935 [Clostridiales bacterium]|nr:hypothetical protein [Clostridiales bacterium]
MKELLVVVGLTVLGGVIFIMIMGDGADDGSSIREHAAMVMERQVEAYDDSPAVE